MLTNERLSDIVNHVNAIGKEETAKKFNVTLETVNRYLRCDRLRQSAEILEDEINKEINTKKKFSENVHDGTAEVEFDVQTEIRTLDQLVERLDVDLTKWNIVRYVQNFWGNMDNPNWQVKVWLSRTTEEQAYQDAFISFLKDYKPCATQTVAPDIKGLPAACLVLNKQDAHLNKYDIGGQNDINVRFDNIKSKLETIASQACVANDIEKITYILGSDEFNSEHTGNTTKGTPQQNIETYQIGFDKICDHELSVIDCLLSHSQSVDIVYVPGNHDEIAGWHLVKWLKTYYRNEKRLSFDTNTAYRKYISYGNTAMMFNHGDAIKPNKLVSMFPIEYKDEWSSHEYFYIFTGDKHHELSHDFNGIKFYQLPAFTSAKSLWDDKNGYTCSRPEATGFLVDKKLGITNIFKQYL